MLENIEQRPSSSAEIISMIMDQMSLSHKHTTNDWVKEFISGLLSVVYQDVSVLKQHAASFIWEFETGFSSKTPPAAEKKKITDFCDEILLSVFANLDIRSLIKVAISNEWLRPAAGEVYRKNCSMTILLPFQPSVKRGVCFGTYLRSIEVYGFKENLQFVRGLGTSLNEVTICVNGDKLSELKCFLESCEKYFRHSVKVTLAIGGMYGATLAQMFDIVKYPFLSNNVISVEAQCLTPEYSIAQPLFFNLEGVDIHFTNFCPLRFQAARDFLTQHNTVNEVNIYIDLVPINTNGTDLLNDILDVLPHPMAKISIYCSIFLLPMPFEDIDAILLRLINEHSLLVELSLHRGIPLTVAQAESLLFRLNFLQKFNYSFNMGHTVEFPFELVDGNDWKYYVDSEIGEVVLERKIQ